VTPADAVREGAAPTPVSPARAAAWKALLRLRGDTHHFEDSLSAFAELEGLSDRDRGLANELVVGTVKRRGSVDAVLGSFTRAPVNRTDPHVLEALRLAAFQLLFLDRVPAYAVVDDSVALVARRGKKAQGFANAVLRKVAAEGREKFAGLAEGDGARSWSVRFSCPVWLVQLLRRELGDEAAALFLAAAAEPPERCLRVNTLRGDAAGTRASLAAAGFTTHGVPGLGSALLYGGPSLERCEPFRRGQVTAQSRGSQIAGLVAAAGSRQNGAVLDLCAAPGTKTAQLAATLPGAGLTAVDADPARVDDMRRNLARLGVEGARLVAADVLDLPPEFDDAYDTVLLDAPCSGLGTLSSRADLRWRRREADVDRLAQLQRRLLRRAARCVRRGGSLTYAVCTLPSAETTGVVDSLLGAGGWALDDLGESWPGMAHPAAGGCLLVLPPQNGSTGFFVARFRRLQGAAG